MSNTGKRLRSICFDYSVIFRHKLYNETIANLYNTRQTVANNIAALREKLSSATQGTAMEHKPLLVLLLTVCSC